MVGASFPDDWSVASVLSVVSSVWSVVSSDADSLLSPTSVFSVAVSAAAVVSVVAGVIIPHWLHKAETEKRRITINKEKRT